MMKTLIFNSDNRPGLSRLFAIPTFSFRRLRRDYINNRNWIEVIDRVNIVEFNIIDPNQFNATENQSIADGGDVWDVNVTGLIPRLANQEVIATLERGEWLVVSQDLNGIVKLYGTMEIPLHFATEKTTGQNNSMNGIRFTFTAKEPNPSITLANDLSLL